MDIQKLFFSFDGRLNRKPYFLSQLGLGVVSGIFAALFGDSTNFFVAISVLAVSLAIFFASVALVVKRLHDLDKKGWWALILLIPLINILFGLYLVFAKGTDGSNRFGDDPLQTF